MKNRFYLLLLSLVFIFSTNAKATNHVITVSGSYPNFNFSEGGNAIDSLSPFNVNLGDSVTWHQDFNYHPLSSISVPAGANPFSNTYATLDSTSDFSYVVTKPGKYTFVCTQHGFTGAFVSSNVSGVRPVNAFPVQVSVYPTVTRSIVNLNVKEGFSAGSKLNAQVYNILGNEIINFDFLPGNAAQINVGSLSSGIYFVAIRQNNKVVAVQKIVKQ